MTKNSVKKIVGKNKKVVKIEKKSSKPGIAKKAVEKKKLIKPSVKLAAAKTSSNSAKIAEKPIKSDLQQKVSKARSSKIDITVDANAIRLNQSVIIAETIINGPNSTREEIVQVDVKAPAEKLKKQTKKAQAAYQAATEEEAKWLELKDKFRGIHPSPYKMSEVYQEKTLLDHKVLGLGVILSVINDRLEVLFQTGTKHLISNYKK